MPLTSYDTTRDINLIPGEGDEFILNYRRRSRTTHLNLVD